MYFFKLWFSLDIYSEVGLLGHRVVLLIAFLDHLGHANTERGSEHTIHKIRPSPQGS